MSGKSGDLGGGIANTASVILNDDSTIRDNNGGNIHNESYAVTLNDNSSIAGSSFGGIWNSGTDDTEWEEHRRRHRHLLQWRQHLQLQWNGDP